MTAAALTLLETDQEGFFLLVEGSQIDWANHRNNLPYQISETLAFDEAVKVVLNWVNNDPKRTMNTLIIIAPDHETGGFAIAESSRRQYGRGDFVEDLWATKKHTAGDVVIWSQGPGSGSLGRAVDNTDIYQVMKKALMQSP
jgi:alkaline phosphatase